MHHINDSIEFLTANKSSFKNIGTRSNFPIHEVPIYM
jgi:hypothetical protein